VFLVLRHREGQGLAEYALILTLLVVVVIIALETVGQALVPMYNNIANSI
jgi:Flp pilus assembly pilin Flp